MGKKSERPNRGLIIDTNDRAKPKTLEELTDEELKDEIMWRMAYMMDRQVEPRYKKQPKEERYVEYKALHEYYTLAFDEAVKRGLAKK